MSIVKLRGLSHTRARTHTHPYTRQPNRQINLIAPQEHDTASSKPTNTHNKQNTPKLTRTLITTQGASFAEVLNIAATGYGLKFVLALTVTPLIYLSRDFLHNKFGLEPIPSDAEDA
jgi:hypothetical protein